VRVIWGSGSPNSTHPMEASRGLNILGRFFGVGGGGFFLFLHKPCTPCLRCLMLSIVSDKASAFNTAQDMA